MACWLELSAEIPAAAADVVAMRLVERGAPGVIEEAAGDRLRLRAHFEKPVDELRLAADVRRLLTELDEFFPGCSQARVTFTEIHEEDWAEGWKRGFPALEIGRRLRVRPPWIAADGSGRHDIEIEPAMAFGTGQHASTLGCLLALEALFDARGVLSPVLDVGTGSGILAIAAARLGAREVVAVDIDPVAVEAARANVKRNGLESRIALRQGSLETTPERFALILANLYSGLLRAMVEDFAERVTPGGCLVVSGLLEGDRDSVGDAAEARGWRPLASSVLDGWATLTFRRAARG